MADNTATSEPNSTPRASSGGNRRRRLAKIIPKETPLPVSIDQRANLSHETNVRLPNGNVVNISAKELLGVRQIGKGAHGVVERMLDPVSKLEFAVKKVPAAGDSYNMEQQLLEMDVNQRTSECPYTVLFYGAMICEGEVYLLMELMDMSLDELYKKVYQRGEVIPETVLRAISFSVVSALHFMKERLRIMHRDVKPSNILADRTGQFKVCDFGIAGNLVNSFARTHVGTQVYMAPERITPDAEGYTAKSDVWSLGVSLYELATGDCPFPRKDTYFQMLQKIVNSAPPRLSETGQGARFSPAFRDFVSKCLVKEVDKRPNFQQLLKHEFLADFNPEDTRSECADFLCRMFSDGLDELSRV